MKRLYVAWQDPKNREWVPVAVLERNEIGYYLRYTRGAQRCSGFAGLGRMSDLDETYFSESLFPFFSNRVISKSRPEYKDYLRWLGLRELEDDPMAMLAVTGGGRATDSLEVISPPTSSNGQLVFDFFPRGLKHLLPGTVDLISGLPSRSRLYLARDLQNQKHPDALLLRTDSPNALAGYMARYYCAGIIQLLSNDSAAATVTVKQVNLDAPLDMQILCTFSATVTEDFKLLECESDFQLWSTASVADAFAGRVKNAASNFSAN